MLNGNNKKRSIVFLKGKSYVVTIQAQITPKKATNIDWKKSIMGETFVFSNPNATSKCGCGSSFGA